MRMLIAGCGYVGIRVAEKLHQSGHEVFGLRRNPPAPLPFLSWYRGDLIDTASISLPPDLDVIVLAAGLRRDTEEAYQRLFVEGYRSLLEKLKLEQPSIHRVVMTSTTGVFAEQDGRWVDENSPVSRDRSPGRYYLTAEKLAADCGLSSTILRLAGIYGPDRVRLIREVREGRARRYPLPVHYLNQLHADDAAGAIAHMALHHNPDSLYIACDREPADRNEVVQWISEKLGLGNLPATGSDEDRPARRAGNKRCRSNRLVDSGYTFIYPTYREGYGSLLHT